MQREIRAQSAAQRREAYGALQQDRRNRQYTRSCDSAGKVADKRIDIVTLQQDRRNRQYTRSCDSAGKVFLCKIVPL